MSNGKWIATTLVLTFGIGLFVGKVTLKPEIITNTETIVAPVDSQAIIQKATEGLIPYNYNALVEEFGSIVKDTNWVKQFKLIPKDSTVYDTQMVYLPVLQGDTTFQFKDSTAIWRYQLFLDIHTTAFLPPVSAIRTEATLRDFEINITYHTKVPKWWESNWLWGGAGLLIGVMAAK